MIFGRGRWFLREALSLTQLEPAPRERHPLFPHRTLDREPTASIMGLAQSPTASCKSIGQHAVGDNRFLAVVWGKNVPETGTRAGFPQLLR
jgi:hypothetical protein